MAETTFYTGGNVTVTNARAVLDGKTYALANVTSVRKHRNPVNYQPAAVLIVLGILLLFSGVGSGGSSSATCLAAGGFLVVIGIVLAVMMKASYSIVLGSASGENQSMTSRNEAEIDQIVAAINNAIVHRG